MAYQAVDPRTRGEAQPFWHHPGKAGVVFRPISAPTLGAKGKYSEEELAFIADRKRCKVNLGLLDFLCGLLSLIALFLTIPGLVSGWNIDNSLRWPMWRETVLCYNASFDANLPQQKASEFEHPFLHFDKRDSTTLQYIFTNHTAAGMQFAYNVTKAMTDQYCHYDQVWYEDLHNPYHKNIHQDLTIREEYMLPRLGRTWKDTRYECSVLTHHVAGFDLWTALRLVFGISLVFQWGRAWLATTSKDHQHNTPSGVQWYDPHKPDFWRWWEYALTSSIQTAIIALSFFVGNRDEVLCLAALQAALCLLGFAIEKRIDKLYKAKIKQTSAENPYKTAFKVAKLCILLTAAWSFFVIIWYILLARFDRQRMASKDCDYGTTMPDAVYFIVFGELALFFLFGLAQTVHVVIALVQTTYRRTPSHGDLASLKRTRLGTWHGMAVVYSILSITAKTILEIGILWLSKEAANMI
jgi:hypothetical protein